MYWPRAGNTDCLDFAKLRIRQAQPKLISMSTIKSNTVFLTLEAITGLGFGISGAYLYSLVDTVDLMTSVFNTFAIAFACMVFGIGVIGYFHLRRTGRLQQFIKAVVFSFVGLFLFLLLYVGVNVLTFKFLPHYVSSGVLPILLPLCGAVMGFNYSILKPSA